MGQRKLFLASRWCCTGRFAATIFGAIQRYNVLEPNAVTIRNIVATMLQRCVTLKIVVANRLV